MIWDKNLFAMRFLIYCMYNMTLYLSKLYMHNMTVHLCKDKKHASATMTDTHAALVLL